MLNSLARVQSGTEPQLSRRWNKGGAPINGAVFRLKPGVILEDAKHMLWRRETGRIGTGERYMPEKQGDVEIRSTENLASVRTVLYAWPLVNLNAGPKHLAELAIASARAKAGDNLRDGSITS